MKKTENKNLTETIKKFSLSIGADLVGIASNQRLQDAPKGHKPTNLLSSAQSVIVCAKRFPNTLVEQGPATSYHKMMTVLDFLLDSIAYKIAVFLEQQGGLAIPVPADSPYTDWDAKNLHGRGELSHKHAAQAAGLGRLGKNYILITSEFGNRVELVSVITNLDLKPDEMIKNDLCPANCTLCIDACPVNAIADYQHVNQKLCRPYMYSILPKGQKIDTCCLCRKVCPVDIKSNLQ